MWITLGFTYIFIEQGIMQLTGTKEYEKPEDCFREAVAVMADENYQVHMACVPIIKPMEES